MTEFAVDVRRIEPMVAYLVPFPLSLPHEIDVSVIFGRCSEDLLAAAIQAAARSRHVIATGRIGKDSGWLRDTTEADYIGDHLDALRTDPSIGPIIRDREARNGLDNARNSVEIMMGLGTAGIRQIVAVTHPVQSKRLTGMLRHALLQKPQLKDAIVTPYPSGYSLNLAKKRDVFEIVNEITLVDDYGRARQPRMQIDELPSEEMVAYARQVKAHLLAEFEARGIKNPSTADGTDPHISHERLMIYTTPGVTDPAAREAAIAENERELARAMREIAAATAR